MDDPLTEILREGASKVSPEVLIWSFVVFLIIVIILIWRGKVKF